MLELMSTSWRFTASPEVLLASELGRAKELVLYSSYGMLAVNLTQTTVLKGLR